jgi:hypothetical protein
MQLSDTSPQVRRGVEITGNSPAKALVEELSRIPQADDDERIMEVPIESGMAAASALPGGHHSLQRWNYPRVNLGRTLATCYALVVLGFNDGIIGVSRRTCRKVVSMLISCRQ